MNWYKIAQQESPQILKDRVDNIENQAEQAQVEIHTLEQQLTQVQNAGEQDPNLMEQLAQKREFLAGLKIEMQEALTDWEASINQDISGSQKMVMIPSPQQVG